MRTTHTYLTTITQEIWAAVLGIDLQLTTDKTEHGADERVVTGAVQITGDWAGACTVQVAEPVAARFAASMFMMELDAITGEEITDTVGELANMIGGNVKATLEGSSQLSLPSVTSGREYTVVVPGSEVKERVAFTADGELIVVTLLERR